MYVLQRFNGKRSKNREKKNLEWKPRENIPQKWSPKEKKLLEKSSRT